MDARTFALRRGNRLEAVREIMAQEYDATAYGSSAEFTDDFGQVLEFRSRGQQFLVLMRGNSATVFNFLDTIWF